MFLDRPIGLLALLDEESSFPQATDRSFIDKCNQHCKGVREYKVAPCVHMYVGGGEGSVLVCDWQTLFKRYLSKSHLPSK